MAPAAFVHACLAEGIQVAAVTDHNFTGNIEAIIAAADGTPLHVIPGLELNTDRGDVLVLSPNADGLATLTEFCLRLGVHDGGQIPFDRLLTDFAGSTMGGTRYRDALVLIGAHVDQAGSLLGSTQPSNVASQLVAAEQLHALEVAKPETLSEWDTASGVKQTGKRFTLIRGSDAHPGTTYLPRSSWLYLPRVDALHLHHALATPESSVRLTDSEPLPPKYWIHSVSVQQGPFDGLTIEFDPRANALIGPPSSGKSFVLDAIRWTLGSLCPIDEVAQASDARLRHCLPAGGSVTVRLMVDGDPHDVTRVRGGAAIDHSPYLPIIFSQTELTRRAMEAAPSIDLLDVHQSDIGTYQRRLRSLGTEAQHALSELAATATKAGELRALVENPQDGLTATQTELASLLGTEPVTKAASDVGRVEAWRKAVGDAIEPLLTVDVPIPTLPPTPELEALPGGSSLLPGPAAEAVLAELRQSITNAAQDAHSRITELLSNSNETLEEENKKITDELDRLGLPSADTVVQRLRALRARVGELETKQHELAVLDSSTDELTDRLCSLIDDGEATRAAIVEARKQTSALLNGSMRTFRVRINEAVDTRELDAALEDLKTGTNLFPDAMRRVRNSLDRKRMARLAATYLAGRPWTPIPPVSMDMENQDAVVKVALDRGKYPLLASTMLLWPRDTLDLFRPDGSSTVRFGDLTEGLRALAIKEISFAASQLPVVTDQPEDAVPTTAVFENLVPTIRTQRADRQFIVASHDANIVVASDVERLFVMSASAGTGPRVGTLFDSDLRNAAMDLLEGGERAFRLRQARYGA